MTLVYRLVKGTPLTKSEGDGNISDLDGRITTLETTPPAAVGIDDFTVVADQMTVIMTDATTRGPFTLPAVALNFRGEWQPSTLYAVNDVITSGGAVYLVLFAHTSESEFDPGANDGSGDDFYGLLLQQATAGVRTQSGTTYDLAAADAGSYIRFTNILGCIVTVPDNATVGFPIGTEFHFRQVTDDGTVIVEEDSFVTINSVEGHHNATARRGAVVTLKKVATNEWDIFGLLAAGSV